MPLEFTVFNPHFSALELDSLADGCAAVPSRDLVPPFKSRIIEIVFDPTKLRVGQGSSVVILNGILGDAGFTRQEEFRYEIFRKEEQRARNR